jgi:DNA-binding response OmpR family regulator
MRILIAEDDPVSRRMLELLVAKWGHEPCLAVDGLEALAALRAPGGPRLALLDWMMPGRDGPAICRELRAPRAEDYTYVIMVTAKGSRADLLEGLAAGADDYVTKPFDAEELKHRLQVGERMLRLHTGLQAKVRELEQAVAHVQRLQGLLPVCMHCKKVRDERQVWHRIEAYIEEHSEARFTHALCEECLASFYPEEEPAGEKSGGRKPGG